MRAKAFSLVVMAGLVFAALTPGIFGGAEKGAESRAPATAVSGDPVSEGGDEDGGGAASSPLWSFFGSLAGALVAAGALWWSVKTWRRTFLTKDWSSLVQCLKDHPEYMDCEKADRYRESFTGTERVKYDLIARLCIGYLDDLYFAVGSKRDMRTWLRGSIALFAGTHRRWLEDNQVSYDPAFYGFVMGELERMDRVRGA